MATATSNIDDLLQCPICLDILQDPKVLDCQHTFCANCLKVHLASIERNHGSSNFMDCPTCRLRSNLINNSIDSLPGNYIVRDIIERQYGTTTPERPPGYAQQIQDRIQKMKKEEDEGFDLEKYIKPAAAALLGILGGLLLAKGAKKMFNDKK
ncbi:unnamed protein product [Adineta steineri]|uniref:RING-type domain-containing protein n=1 Tax=Adineta steineri TaxID=433720 RepID=A0A814QCZ4_9BILA|nr:unnamed protein product [Adineta steineri]CAF1117814.1 unnamed protein product [Adineta steineri]CAF3522132.1 unnamed protein product [Adineta steineri]CAF3663247.1 unnamed protein product [Adineta steineri]